MKKSTIYLRIIATALLLIAGQIAFAGDSENALTNSGEGYAFNFSNSFSDNCAGNGNGVNPPPYFSGTRAGYTQSTTFNGSMTLTTDGTQRGDGAWQIALHNKNGCSYSTVNLSNSNYRVLEMRVKSTMDIPQVLAIPIDNQFYIGDKNAEVKSLVANQWTTLTFDISSMQTSGNIALDASKIQYSWLAFRNAWDDNMGGGSSVNGSIEIDYITIGDAVSSVNPNGDGGNYPTVSGNGYEYKFLHEGGGISGHNNINCIGKMNVNSTNGVSVSGNSLSTDDFFDFTFDGAQGTYGSCAIDFFDNSDCGKETIDLSNLANRKIKARIKVSKACHLGIFATTTFNNAWTPADGTGFVLHKTADTNWQEVEFDVPNLDWQANVLDLSICNGITIGVRDYNDENTGISNVTVSIDWIKIGDANVTCSAPTISTQPSSTSACLGQNASFNVTASNATGYKWYKSGNGAILSTTSSLDLSNIDNNDLGDYYVVVTSACGNVTSSTASLTETNGGVSVTALNEDKTVCIGDGSNFNVSITANSSYTLEWKKVGSNTVYSTSSVLYFTNISSSDFGKYYASATSSCGTFNSDTMELINCQPQNDDGNNYKTITGAGYVFNFEHAGGGKSYHETINCISTSDNYNHFNNSGFDFEGQENQSNDYVNLSIDGSQSTYDLTTLRFFDNSNCSYDTVDLSDPNNKIIQVRVKSDVDIQFAVYAFGEEKGKPGSHTGGYDNVAYGALSKNLWKTVSFQVSDSYSWKNLDLTKVVGLQFTVRDFNNTSQKPSSPVNLLIDWIKVGDGTLNCIKPTIVTQPKDTALCLGVQGQISLQASNYTNIEWKNSNGSVIGSSLVLDFGTLGLGEYDTYYAEIANSCGISTTQTITVSERSTPTFTAQPKGVPACLGESNSFTATPADAQSFVWRKAGDQNTQYGTSETLNFSNVVSNNYGAYLMEATNECGSSYSDTAYLSACYNGSGNGNNFVTNSSKGYVYNFAHQGGGVTTHESINCMQNFNIAAGWGSSSIAVGGMEQQSRDFLSVEYQGGYNSSPNFLMRFFDNTTCFAKNIDLSTDPSHLYIQMRIKATESGSVSLYAWDDGNSISGWSSESGVSVEANKWKIITVPVTSTNNLSLNAIQGIAMQIGGFPYKEGTSYPLVDFLIDWVQVGDGIVDITVGGTEISENEINIYPNPSSGTFTLEGNYKSFKVFDIQGSQVLDKTTLIGARTMFELSSGVYFVRITSSDNKLITKRIVVSK